MLTSIRELIASDGVVFDSELRLLRSLEANLSQATQVKVSQHDYSFCCLKKEDYSGLY